MNEYQADNGFKPLWVNNYMAQILSRIRDEKALVSLITSDQLISEPNTRIIYRGKVNAFKQNNRAFTFNAPDRSCCAGAAGQIIMDSARNQKRILCTNKFKLKRN
jgi:hypothetical protein